MSLNLKQQIKKLLENSKNILLLTPMIVDGDSLGSGLALYMTFKKMGKKVTLICPGEIPDNLRFLPNLDVTKTEFEGSRDFIITLDATNSEVDKLKYNVEDKKLNIIITPKSGAFQESDVSFSQSSSKVDLVFVLDSSNLELIGPAYTDNVDFFLRNPNCKHRSPR